MSKFWNWYDGLAKDQGSLRFGIFFTLAIITMVIVPVSGILFFGLTTETSQLIGLTVIVILAASKHFRFPK